MGRCCELHPISGELGYDSQRAVPVLEGDTPDTLAARVFEAECDAYPEAIRLFANRRLKTEDGSRGLNDDLLSFIL